MVLKRVARAALSARILVSSRRRFIFVHHDVSETSEPVHSPFYSTTPSAFREQVAFLSSHLAILSLPQLLGQGSGATKRPSAALVFDDGFASIRREAVPFLLERGIPFSVFVNPIAVREDRLDYLPQFSNGLRRGRGRTYLSQTDLRCLADEGATFGNHSMTHASLAGLTAEARDYEIQQSKDLLQELVGASISYFGLPYGKREHYDQQALDTCFESGHKVVFTSNPTSFCAEDAARERPLIPRIGITSQTPRDLTFLMNRPLVKQVDL